MWLAISVTLTGDASHNSRCGNVKGWRLVFPFASHCLRRARLSPDMHVIGIFLLSVPDVLGLREGLQGALSPKQSFNLLDRKELPNSPRRRMPASGIIMRCRQPVAGCLACPLWRPCARRSTQRSGRSCAPESGWPAAAPRRESSSIEFSISTPISESRPKSVSGWSSRKVSGFTRSTEPTASRTACPDDTLQLFRSCRFDLETQVIGCASRLLAFDGCENALQ